jgi:hypothetical protein
MAATIQLSPYRQKAFLVENLPVAEACVWHFFDGHSDNQPLPREFPQIIDSSLSLPGFQVLQKMNGGDYIERWNRGQYFLNIIRQNIRN